MRSNDRFAAVRRRLQSEVAIALLLFVAAFGLYTSTMGGLVGYESETAAVAEGLVRSGKPEILPGSRIPVAGVGQLTHDGHRFGRTGLAQPLLEAPFYAVGYALDSARNGGNRNTLRVAFLRLYNPFMAALTVMAIYLILRSYGRPRRRSLGMAALAGVGSLIWPYSKIGMDTTMMAMVALMVLAAAWASRRGGAWRYCATGVLAGAVAASKPVGIVMLIGLLAFAEPLRAMSGSERRRLLVAFAVPLVAWAVAIAWYNAYRTGSVTNFNGEYAGDLFDAPIAFVGTLISPGKGLVFFCPLVVLGALGLPKVWREQRQLALAIILTFLANLVVISGSRYWAGDTWGPRYVVCSAWLLLLPIAWWLDSPVKRRVLAAVATVAVFVQIAGVFSPYYVGVKGARRLSGVPVYTFGVPPTDVAPYGNEGPAWVPSVSPLRFESLVAVAWVKQQLTGTGFVVTYSPFLGKPGRVDLRHPSRALGLPLPDEWWTAPSGSWFVSMLGALVALLGLASALGLARVVRLSENSPPCRAPVVLPTG